MRYLSNTNELCLFAEKDIAKDDLIAIYAGEYEKHTKIPDTKNDKYFIGKDNLDCQEITQRNISNLSRFIHHAFDDMEGVEDFYPDCNFLLNTKIAFANAEFIEDTNIIDGFYSSVYIKAKAKIPAGSMILVNKGEKYWDNLGYTPFLLNNSYKIIHAGIEYDYYINTKVIDKYDGMICSATPACVLYNDIYKKKRSVISKKNCKNDNHLYAVVDYKSIQKYFVQNGLKDDDSVYDSSSIKSLIEVQGEHYSFSQIKDYYQRFSILLKYFEDQKLIPIGDINNAIIVSEMYCNLKAIFNSVIIRNKENTKKIENRVKDIKFAIDNASYDVDAAIIYNLILKDTGENLKQTLTENKERLTQIVETEEQAIEKTRIFSLILRKLCSAQNNAYLDLIKIVLGNRYFNCNLYGSSNKTALDISKEFKNKKIYNLLKEKGAKTYTELKLEDTAQGDKKVCEKNSRKCKF